MTDGYATTQPELAAVSAESPYGGITGRPRELCGYLELPDGRRFYLGNIGIKFDGWGDGLFTEVDLHIKPEIFEECEKEEGGAK